MSPVMPDLLVRADLIWTPCWRSGESGSRSRATFGKSYSQPSSYYNQHFEYHILVCTGIGKPVHCVTLNGSGIQLAVGSQLIVNQKTHFSDLSIGPCIGYPRTRASGESSTTKHRLHMLRDLTQSRHLMTLTDRSKLFRPSELL
ncbi:hypothetical protein F511_30688 [Dorcoceras hygrometricum]|uniref:Uncharacterized protein n=1 Tax=Dorcoceras hygrometricum TaxID=472368 RepID=A0A2Z7CGA9_9LAMI|nr:hypothetical protein F511_30688 [Dorcoceras hygrometricum]